jgi:hypothetical protein
MPTTSQAIWPHSGLAAKKPDALTDGILSYRTPQASFWALGARIDKKSDPINWWF